MKKLIKYAKKFKNCKKIEELKNFGFKKTREGFENSQTWINYEEKIVIKRPFLIYKKKPKRAVETLSVKKFGTTYFIQPLVNTQTKTRHKAFNFFSKNWHLLPQTKIDFHDGNVGKHKNKYVLIDW